MTENLIESAKTASRGGVQIFFSNILTTLISAVGSIIVVRVLSTTEYGLYTIAGIPASMIGMFGDWGVNTALTKYIAQYRSEGKENAVASVLHAGLIFKIALGLILASLTFLLSEFLTNFVLQKSEAVLLVQVSCLLVLGNQLCDTSWSIFVGFETMNYNALLQILRAVLKALLAPLLVLLGFEALGAVLGWFIGNLAVGVVCVLIIFFSHYRPLRKASSGETKSFIETTRMMLRYSLPLGVLTIVGGFGGQLYLFLMTRYSSAFDIGNYGVASQFMVLIAFITFPIGNVIFPFFSKISGDKTREKLEVAFRASVKYVSFLVLPAAVGVMVLSQPLIYILFGNKYSLAPLFLVFLSVGSLYSGLGSMSMGSLLSSQGETRMILRIGLLTLLVGVPLSFVLIPYFGVLGFVVNNLITQAVGTILYIYWVRKLFKFKMWISQSLKIYVTAFTMGGLVWTTLSLLRLWAGINNDSILLGSGFLVGVSSYILLLPLIGAIKPTELNDLTVISKQFGPLNSIFNITFAILTRMVRIRNRMVGYYKSSSSRKPAVKTFEEQVGKAGST
jgi:O-antigen/teichoic acid export membrane protein